MPKTTLRSSEPKSNREGEQLKKIGVSLGITINMGDFESARVDVWEEGFTTEEQKEATYDKLWDSVQKQVRDEIDRVTGEEPEEPKKKKPTKKKKTSR